MTLLGERISGEEGHIDVQVGEIRERTRMRVDVGPDESYTRRVVRVGDLSDVHAVARDNFNHYLDALNHLAFLNKDTWEIPTEHNNFQTNAGRSMFYSRFPGNETMRAWQEYIMEARALYPLQRPHDAERVLPDGVDDYARDVFMFATDSIGIRSRAAIMKDVAIQAAANVSGHEINILSLGSGAAVPTIDAASAMREQLGKTVKMELCDLSSESLSLAANLMSEAHIPAGDVDMYVGNFIRKIHESKKRGSRFNIVEALGLFEYLDPRVASNLLRDSYSMVEPGGVVVVSNMLTDRRQLQLNQFVVGWPDVVPRSEHELVNLALDANINPEEITLTIPDDGVYAVLEIHKPW